MKQNHSIHLGNYRVPEHIINGICIDIGGNTGQFSLKYAYFFRLIHVYEPQRECYEIIKKNIYHHKNIKLFNEAAYHTSDMYVDLISHSSYDSGSVAIKDNIIVEDEWVQDVVDSKCPTISLTDIIARVGDNVDYMKIDCETSEYHLLMNQDLSKIKYIGIELHWQMGKKNYEDLIKHLLKYFYTDSDISYTPYNNKEAFFVSKYI